MLKSFLEKVQKNDQQAEKEKTERVIELGRRRREEIAKWNQMTALRFPTGGRQTSLASLWGSQSVQWKNVVTVFKFKVTEKVQNVSDCVGMIFS